jgi:peptidoglycan/xylan/chitin deacetylase (PgdA/CDA1 family)
VTRKNAMAYFLASSFLLTSCASNKHHVNSNHNVVNAGVGTSIVTDRIPSSSIEEENLNNSFDLLMGSENPEKSFLEFLDRQKSIYVRSEAYLADFDKEIDENVANSSKISLVDSKPYKKLIVMWSISERLKDKMIFFYLKLADIIRDKSQDVNQRNIAKNILRSFNKKLKSQTPVEKFAFDEFKIELALAVKEKRAIEKGKASADTTIEPTFKSEREKLVLLRRHRKSFLLAGQKEQAVNDELSQSVENDAEKLQFTENEGREPQSLAYAPGVGSSGNVMGLAFPKNVWALTYDDGPNPTHTTTILNNLEKLGIKATFFWLAQNVIRYQSVVDMAHEKGMIRANHSWSHAQLPKISEEALNKEIVQSTAAEKKAYGVQPKYFRCPYGAGNSVPRIRKMIADLGMLHVFWNVDTVDWQDKDPDSIVARTQKQMKAAGHGVVLFHDIHPQSVIASRKLVEWSKTFTTPETKIRWVTLPEIVDEMNGASK